MFGCCIWILYEKFNTETADWRFIYENVSLICHTKGGKHHLKRNYTGIMNSPFVLSFKANVCNNKVSMKQPLLEAAGGME